MKFEKMKKIFMKDGKCLSRLLKRKILKCLKIREWEYRIENKIDLYFILGNREIFTANMKCGQLVSILEEIWEW